MKYLNDKTIILATLGMLFVSFVFLSAIEARDTNLNNQNIWMLYFVEPKDNSLDFTIENHSKNTDFHFEVLVKKTKVSEENISISKGETKIVPLSIEDLENKKITITVTAGNDKKEIYKSL